MIEIRLNSVKVTDSCHICVSSCLDSIRAWSLRAIGLRQYLCDGLSVKRSVLLPPFSSLLQKKYRSSVTNCWFGQFTRREFWKVVTISRGLIAATGTTLTSWSCFFENHSITVARSGREGSIMEGCPEEVKLLIFRELPPASLFAAACVSTSWYSPFFLTGGSIS